MKTKLQILSEIVRWYSFDTKRRAVGKYGICLYHNDNDNVCAVGKCLINPKRFGRKYHPDKCETGVANIPSRSLSNALKPEYRGHEIDFWSDIQWLHDNSRNWKPYQGLTESGKETVKYLKEKWKNK